MPPGKRTGKIPEWPSPLLLALCRGSDLAGLRFSPLLRTVAVRQPSVDPVTTEGVPAPVAAAIPPSTRLLALMLLALLWPLMLCARGWWLLRSLTGGGASPTAQTRTVVCQPYGRATTGPPPTFSLTRFRQSGAPIVTAPGILHLLGVFIPALPAIIAGRLALVGVTARTPEELATVPEPWRRMISAVPAGIVTSALFSVRRSGSIRWNGSPADAMTVFADAAYCTTRSTGGDMLLFCRYLLWCLRPGGGA